MGRWFTKQGRNDLDQLLPSLQHWFDGELGQELLEQQRILIDQSLALVFGYHCAYIGIADAAQLLANSRIGHHFTICPSANARCGIQQVRCDYGQWALADRSVDAVVLHHALDFCLQPQQLLREASRCVIPGGKVILTGFNPYSGMHMLNRCFPRRRQPLSQGRFISARRIQDWLQLLGYSVDEVSYGAFLPLTSKPSLQLLEQRMTHLGRRWHLPLGGFYVIQATREEQVVTPLRPRWRVPRKRLVTGVAVERNSRRRLVE
ncbi:class I SAM-dependent methyltransferase [Aestuariirhabdus sp. Z084]|uniref:methyltransferase domain-containing protein n=1 Tax=Aestuariirhabdus haliotis TaxID=2918751 RepID=UPI00201B3D84|nr:methyltransferase domain-containing protein [Aestuariirhabdus haliotis]MCL6414577.1 class I SAM-dependent methyltransferase [Aestuariirhabdus haliotis]MCL6418441.1 class I SAM-dependent methyltransferase [Aestuariirhabdus haliotis]